MRQYHLGVLHHLLTAIVGAMTCVLLPVSGTAKDTSVQRETDRFEEVTGTGCYRYGDNETPALAKSAARTLAQEEAVRSHRVFVQASSTVKNFELEQDLVHTVSAGLLKDVKIEREEKKDQEICISIKGKISIASTADLIQQQVNAKQIAQAAQTPLMPEGQGYGLKLWVNKEDGHYLEGERLVVYVQAERDAFLKMDYFQADGCVVHLVPNVYRGQAFIRGGRTYTFGGDGDPEHIVITGPFGAETIKAILSASPINIIEGNDEPSGCDDSRRYLQRLQTGVRKGVRGARLMGVDRSVSLVTTSKLVDDYRRERGGQIK
jgi:hypothetical protein